MMGKRSVVSTQILAEQPKAMATHSQGHSLSLAIKSITKDCTILRDVMGNMGKICVLVKYSSKQEKIRDLTRLYYLEHRKLPSYPGIP